MEVGDTINLEAHNGALLTVIAAQGVELNYVKAGTATFESNTGNVRFGLLRQIRLKFLYNFRTMKYLLIILSFVSGNLIAQNYHYGLENKENEGSTFVDRIPLADAGTDRALALPDDIAVLMGTGSDPDGGSVSYQWTQISGPSTVIFTDINVAELTISSLIEGTYVFQFGVTDDEGNTVNDQVSVFVSTTFFDALPIAYAGADRSITLPENTVLLMGTGSDPDGGTVTYLWTQVSGPSTATLINTETSDFTADTLVEGDYVFELAVTDDEGNTVSDQVSVSLTFIDELPLAYAGADLAITLSNNTALLTGRGSDPDGGTVSYQWIQVSGPNTADLTDSATTTLTIALLVEGTYVFRFEVTDDEGNTVSDQVSVSVSTIFVDLPPVADAGANIAVTLPEDTVVLIGTGSDPDGGTVTFLWTQVSGPNSAILTDANSTNLTVEDLVTGDYVFDLTVTDDEDNTVSDQVSVSVAAAFVDELPLANAGADIIISLPTETAVLNGTGSDPDGGPVTYRWTQLSGPDTAILINADTAILTADTLVEGGYVFDFAVIDNEGNTVSDRVAVIVEAAFVDEQPLADAGADISLTLPDNTAQLSGTGSDPDGGSVTYLWTQLSGPSSAGLTNANSMNLSVGGLIAGDYVFEFAVSDEEGNTVSDEVTVSVEADFVDEQPLADAGDNITLTLPDNTVQLNGTGSDPDGGSVAYLWTQDSGPGTATLTNANTANLNVGGLIAGDYVFEFAVSDDEGNTVFDEVSVSVEAAFMDEQPLADAGVDISLTLPDNTAQLSGTGSDPDGGAVTYLWAQLSGPGSADLTGANTTNLTIGGLIEGNYVFSLEVTDEEGNTVSDEVTVIVNDIPGPVENSNYLFTNQAKNELKRRFENGYSTGAGFTDDISRTLANVTIFRANPSISRPTFGENPNNMGTSDRQTLYHSALYAYAIDDVSLANLISTELLATVQANNMNSTFWAGVANFNTNLVHVSSYHLQAAEIKKMKDSYYLIKNLQNNLTHANKITIEAWFADFGGIVRAWVDDFFDIYWGSDWENRGFTKFYGEDLYTETEYSTAYPVEDVNGIPDLDYVMTGAQNQFNNRYIELINFLYSWSISAGDIETEFICREYFKSLIKYGLFSDGSFWELTRNQNIYNINELGVWYSFSTLSAMVGMAHLDAMTNHFPNDRLYDYKTTEGVVKGSTTITFNPYKGSSTTDGTTLKSLKSFIIGQSNYYRSSANGGWGDARFYDGSPLNMQGFSERDYSIPQAIANLYYKDQNLKDFYLYNTAVGYPVKDPFNDGAFNGEDGNIGTSILGGAWFEQEGNFFN